jgi:hypothetical protein
MKVENNGQVIITYPVDVDIESTDMRVIVNKFAKDQPTQILDEEVKF